MKYTLFIILMFAVLSHIINCDSTNPAESEPTFNNFQEEVQCIIESNFTFGGVAVGVIRGSEDFPFFSACVFLRLRAGTENLCICAGHPIIDRFNRAARAINIATFIALISVLPNIVQAG